MSALTLLSCFVHLCVCALCICIIGEMMCGCTVSPRNSICFVNALFKTINIHSGLYTHTHTKKSTKCSIWFVCVFVCFTMMGALMRRGEYAWACVWAAGPPSDRLPGSRCVEVLSGCCRGLPEWEETRTHSKLFIRADSLFFFSTHVLDQHSLNALLRLSAVLWCTHTHIYSHVYTQIPPSPIPPPLASPCVWCGLWRTTFKEIILQLWSRSMFPTLFLQCFLFYLLTVCQLGGKRAKMEQDTCPTFSVYHVLYLRTWEGFSFLFRSLCFL